MIQQIRNGLLAAFIAVAPLIRAQQFTNNTFGHWYTNAGVNGVTIGTNLANAPAALTVRGGDMFTPNTELFRTITPTGQNGFWSAYRNNIRIGEVYTGNPGLGFHLRAVMDNGGGIQQPGILWMENDDRDGMMIRSNDLTGLYNAPVNTYPLANQGFASLGVNFDGTDGTLTMPSRARLQMVDVDGAVEEPWRPYDRNGTLFTGNHDMAYVGHRYYHGAEDDPWHYETDHSDLLINAGEDNMEDPLRQRIRFTYTTTPDATATTGAATYDGLEFMQLWPEKADLGYVGIGDFTAATQNPSERLDILSRTIRLRDFGTPGLYHEDSYDRVLVVDPVYGLVHWRDANTIGSGGGSGCNWNYVAGANKMYTAYGTIGLTSCPEDDWLVGIGNATPQFKLDVHHARGSTSAMGGVRSDYLGGNIAGDQFGISSSVAPEAGAGVVPKAVGLQAEVSGVSSSGRGTVGVVKLNTASSVSDATGAAGKVDMTAGSVAETWGTKGEVEANISGTAFDKGYGSYGKVYTAPGTSVTRHSVGMYGLSQVYGTVPVSIGAWAISTWKVGATVANSYGLMATSTAQAGATQATLSYGVFAQANNGNSNFSLWTTNPGTGPNDWSAWLDGKTYVAGTIFIPSDENLKGDIHPLENATEQLMLLDPSTYHYLTEEYPHMGLPQGLRYGFIAQQVAQHFPGMVTMAHHPAELDSLGQEIHPAVDFMAMSTGEMIPLLVGGFKEDHALIVNLQNVVAQLQEQLAACCANGSDQRSLTNGNGSSTAMETDLRIVPNPVADITELRYTLAQDGRVRLEVTDPSGHSIFVQEEGSRTTGAYVYNWNTTRLAPGSYYCTLYVNDAFIVKKAVKLDAR